MNQKFLFGDIISLGAFIYFPIRAYNLYQQGNQQMAYLFAAFICVMAVLKFFELKRRNVF
jgi:hypothetical protein